jgi:putative oxidoreductase
MKYLPFIGRILFSKMFITSGFHHFSDATIQYATSKHVPMPAFFVPFSGMIAIVGGLLILLGFKAKLGAWLLVIFLVPVTIVMHNYWAILDPMAQQMQRINFDKNTSMLGGAILIAYFGSGPVSVDALFRKKPSFYN